MGDPSVLLAQLRVARESRDAKFVGFTAWILWGMGDDLANLALQRLVGGTMTVSTGQRLLAETAADAARFEALTEWCVDFVHRRPSGKRHPRQWLPRRICDLEAIADVAEVVADPDIVSRSVLVELLITDDELRECAELPELKHPDHDTQAMLGRYQHVRARLIRAAGGVHWGDFGSN